MTTNLKRQIKRQILSFLETFIVAKKVIIRRLKSIQ